MVKALLAVAVVLLLEILDAPIDFVHGAEDVVEIISFTVKSLIGLVLAVNGKVYINQP